MRFCFLILSAPYKPWNGLTKSCAENTWLRQLNDNHLAFEYIGKPMGVIQNSLYNRFLKSRHSSFFWRKEILPLPTAHFSGSRRITIDINEAWDTMTRKFLSAASLIHEVFEYDFLIKVNTTTYVNVLKLERELFGFSGKKYWGGAIEKNKPFTGGWATVLSREFVDELLENVRNPDTNLKAAKYEDETIGEFLNAIGGKPHAIEFAKVSSNLDLEIPLLNEFSFIRVKSEVDRFNLDPKLFSSVHRKIQNA